MFVDLSKVHQRAIIIAAGQGSRWKNYLDNDKHFATVNGETILERTVRLCRENGIDDVWVAGRDKRYKVDGAELFIPTLTPEYAGADKFLSSRELWLDEGRTITLYGDVYFTDDAMHTIATANHHDWTLFARPYGSKLTRCQWGECFAVTFFEGHKDEHERMLLREVEMYHAGRSMDPSGWQHYRVMTGLPLRYWDRAFALGDRLKVIDDWTEDFDTSGDYLRWMAAKAAPCVHCGGPPVDVPIEAADCIAALNARERKPHG